MKRGQFLKTALAFPILSTTKLEGSNLLRFIQKRSRSFEMTPDMKDAYEVALSILKPSKSQLEHGLELHKNSLVFDTYSFQPYAAIDGKLMAETIGENASVLEIHDLKEDMMMTRFVESERERIEYENAWKASGVTCIFQNAGEEGNAINKLIKRLAHYTYTTDMMGDFVTKAVLPEDIVRAKNEDRRVLYFSGNGVPLPQEWVSEEEELRYIRVFFQLGIRMMHLTYNRRNKIGDGCAETSNAGLSEFGKAVVKRMNKVGVIVDIAHSGWRTSLEAARISERPVVASHSTSASIKEHIRSKPDEVIKAVADSGGYIGICCIPRFLGGTGDISAMMKHIDFVAKKFGFDYVGIGTDKGYSSKYAEEEGNLVNAYPKSRTRFEGLWPEDPFVTSPEMIQSMAWTNWPLFTVGLVMMGYSDYDIQKILGGNALRVANAVLS